MVLHFYRIMEGRFAEIKIFDGFNISKCSIEEIEIISSVKFFTLTFKTIIEKMDYDNQQIFWKSEF